MNKLVDDLHFELSSFKDAVISLIRYLTDNNLDNNLLIRMNSYLTAIDNCFDNLSTAKNFIENYDYVTAQSYIYKICAISDMLKNDALDVLLTKQTGFDEVPETFMWN